MKRLFQAVYPKSDPEKQSSKRIDEQLELAKQSSLPGRRPSQVRVLLPGCCSASLVSQVLDPTPMQSSSNATLHISHYQHGNVSYEFQSLSVDCYPSSKLLKCCFQHRVDAVLYAIPLSCYYQYSNGKNCFITALNYFYTLCRQFGSGMVFLVFTDVQAFRDAILEHHLRAIPEFEDYNGRFADAEEAIQYFVNRIRGWHRECYKTTTCYIHILSRLPERSRERLLSFLSESSRLCILEQNLNRSLLPIVRHHYP